MTTKHLLEYSNNVINYLIRRRNPSNLCNISKNISKSIWQKLSEARNLSHQLSEVTITDELIIGFKNNNDSNYEVRSTTLNQERAIGADWEIWFTGPSRKWLYLRVQSKIINFNTMSYLKLYYKPKSSNLSQTEILINRANICRAIPMYCLYTCWSDHDSISINLNHEHRDIKYFGVSIISANKVLSSKSIKNGIKLKNISNYLSPLPNLFCFDGLYKSDLPNRSLEYLKNNDFLNSEIEYLLDSAPAYVNNLLISDTINQSKDGPDKNVGLITVFREKY